MGNTVIPQPMRQRVRKAVLFVSLLLFPLSLYYFSPALIIQGASEGVVNGSFIVFGLMFLSALFVGRLWCGWACPAGALQEFGAPINDRPARGGKWDWTKWGLWIPWVALIGFVAIQAGGYRTVDPFYQLTGGLTVLQEPPPPWFLAYYIIIALFLGVAVVAGRRASCHYLCWMAPFMILGRRVRNLVRWPSLRLAAESGKCSHCERCTRGCPMSLDVHGMVNSGDMENDECVLCGACVDNCPQGVIRYSFSGGK